MSSFTGSTRPFDNDGYIGYDPRLPSQRFDSFSNLDTQSVKDSVGDSTPIFANQAFGTADQVFSSQPVTEAPSPSPVYSDGEGFSKYSPEQNDDEFDGGFGASDGPILPPPAEMRAEEGFALREWRRHNAMRLEEKDKKEKDMLKEIIEEANEYKVELYRKRSVTIENNKAVNREKEKLFLANREKFHAEAEKNYWKAIGELIPHEVPIIEKRGKDKEKKRSIVVIQGPKPGKPTDLSRMRQALLKLKHNPPAHMKPKPLPSSETKIDSKTTPPASVGASASSAPPKAAAVATGKALAAF